MSDRRPHAGLVAGFSPTRRVAATLALLLTVASMWLTSAAPSATARPATGARQLTSSSATALRDVTVTANARVHVKKARGGRLGLRARTTQGRSYRLVVRVGSKSRVSVAVGRDTSSRHTARLTGYHSLRGSLKTQTLRLQLRVTGQSPVRVAGTVALGNRRTSLVATDRSSRRLTQAGTAGAWSTRSRAFSWSSLQTRAVAAPTPRRSSDPASAHTTTPTVPSTGKPAAVTGTPFLNQQTQSWKNYAAESNPSAKRMYYNIASTPTATWLNGAAGDADYARWIEDRAVSAGAVPQFVLYAIPGRDCGGYSTGGAGSPSNYRAWVSSFAAAIGSRPAIVILEPDAISFCNNDAKVRALRTDLLTYAAKTLHDRAPNTAAYLHAGSGQLSYAYAVSALRDSGIRYLRGFAMNVSSIAATSVQIAFGDALVSKLAAAGVPGRHYVVDTSRNGVGSQPNPGARYASCNNMRAALGSRPTTRTASSAADAYLWIKPPGSSDGTCHSGDPRAGAWFPAMAQALVRNAVRTGNLHFAALP